MPRFPFSRKNVTIPYVVNHLCNLYTTHWCRLQGITSWLFWLWNMAVAWLYLPLTFSRLSLRNLGMWAWARTLKACKVFTKVGQSPWLKRRLCLGCAGVINCTPLSTLSFGVSLFPGGFDCNLSMYERERLLWLDPESIFISLKNSYKTFYFPYSLLLPHSIKMRIQQQLWKACCFCVCVGGAVVVCICRLCT